MPDPMIRRRLHDDGRLAGREPPRVLFHQRIINAESECTDSKPAHESAGDGRSSQGKVAGQLREHVTYSERHRCDQQSQDEAIDRTPPSPVSRRDVVRVYASASRLTDQSSSPEEPTA